VLRVEEDRGITEGTQFRLRRLPSFNPRDSTLATHVLCGRAVGGIGLAGRAQKEKKKKEETKKEKRRRKQKKEKEKQERKKRKRKERRKKEREKKESRTGPRTPPAAKIYASRVFGCDSP